MRSLATLCALPRDADVYITRVMRDFDVPDVSVAVVLNGRVLLAKGYGVRKLGEATPVDERTVSHRSGQDGRGVTRDRLQL